jgi:hypothetical protein
MPTPPTPVASPPINAVRPPVAPPPAAPSPVAPSPSNVFHGGRPEQSVTLGPCDESTAGVHRTNCPPARPGVGPSAPGPLGGPPYGPPVVRPTIDIVVPPPRLMPPTIEIVVPPPIFDTPDQPPVDLPPVIETDVPPLVAPPPRIVTRRRPPSVPPPYIDTVDQPPPVIDTPDQPPVDTPPIVDTNLPPDVPPPLVPPLIDTYVPPPPAVAGPGIGCVLRFVGSTLYYLRPGLNEAYPVPDLDVARVKCDFSGQTGSCRAGFPIDDPDPACRLGQSAVIKGPLQMDHCLYGTIDMSRANSCLPVAWAKTQLVLMDGQMFYVRLDTKTLYPVTQAVANRKGFTELTNCDSPAIGYCRSLRVWNVGPSVQVDTCLAGTIPMSRRQDCAPPG